MTRLSNEELNAIRERCEKATPGPWVVAPELCGPEGQGVYETDSFGCICEVGDPYPRGNNRPQENMEFIAAARTDVTNLLAHIEKRESDIVKLANDWSTIVDEKNALQAEVERLRVNQKRLIDELKKADKFSDELERKLIIETWPKVLSEIDAYIRCKRSDYDD